MEIQNLFAQRIGGKEFGINNEVYKFALIKKWKQEAEKKHSNNFKLIDMGVGEPDWAADDKVVDMLSIEAGKPENRFYSDNGIPEFQNAAIKYMEEVFGISNLTINYVIHGIGSKPILAMLPSCFINPGDYVLNTIPGYTVLATHAKYLGGKIYDLPLKVFFFFYPDFSEIPREVLEKTKLLYINYPNNPTGQVATKEFFENVVKFAQKNNIIVIHDAAYAALTYNDVKPLSFLSVDGAIDVGVEIHSLSKAFNMTGWRLGFLVGNEKIVSAYGVVKDNTDSGQFRAIQKAGAFALNNRWITENTVNKYSRRFKMLIEALNEVGFNCVEPKGTFYSYVKIPTGTEEGVKFNTALEVARYILLNANISVVPWDDCGHYLRFSVTFSATHHEEKIIIDEMKNRLKRLKFVF